MRAMIIKEFRELRRDRRTIALILAMPLVLLLVLGHAANFTVETSRILVIGPAATSIAEELAGNTAALDNLELTVRESDSNGAEDETAIDTILREENFDAVLDARDGDTTTTLATRTHLWIDGSQLFAAQATLRYWMEVLSEDVQTRAQDVRAQVEEAREQADEARAAIEELRDTLTAATAATSPSTAAATAAPPPAVASLLDLPEALELPELPEFPDTSVLDIDSLDPDEVTTVAYNPDLKTSWVMVPGLIGLILTFVGTIVTTIGLVREREAGTMEQLAVLPLSSASIIGGKIGPYLFLALMDAALITAAGVWLFGVPFRGSALLFALLALVFVFVVLGIGILISSISQNTGQAIQVAMMTVMPQILLSGFVFPLDSMATWVRWIGYCLPLTWFIEASRAIMLKGAGMAEVTLPLGILCALAALVFTAATARMALSLRRGGAMQ